MVCELLSGTMGINMQGSSVYLAFGHAVPEGFCHWNSKADKKVGGIYPEYIPGSVLPDLEVTHTGTTGL